MEISADATLYAEVKLFGASFKPELNAFSGTIFPVNKDPGTVHSLKTIDLNSLELAHRDYAITDSTRSRATGIEAEDTYPDGTPQMVKLSDGTLLAVWVTDLGTKSSENRTTLVYSVQKKGRRYVRLEEQIFIRILRRRAIKHISFGQTWIMSCRKTLQ